MSKCLLRAQESREHRRRGYTSHTLAEGVVQLRTRWEGGRGLRGGGRFVNMRPPHGCVVRLWGGWRDRKQDLPATMMEPAAAMVSCIERRGGRVGSREQVSALAEVAGVQERRLRQESSKY